MKAEATKENSNFTVFLELKLLARIEFVILKWIVMGENQIQGFFLLQLLNDKKKRNKTIY